ncbi:MAG TPA: metallophosphoesterase [Burkholderiales bacterium]|jgi:predicted MPP superfamily phosphohydrolase|nr:metallophosphoesterase [Burkholderiales bacterium]
MNRLFNPFIATVSTILALGYAYLAWRLASGAVARLGLAVPFLLIWIVPVVYWTGEREHKGRVDDAVHFMSYLSMGWLNFAIVLCAGRDALLLTTAALPVFGGLHATLREAGTGWVWIGSLAALAAGAFAALRGPHVRQVDIAIDGLDADLEGLRIVQISDLHIGLTIRASYVRRVVHAANALRPDLVALTGDMVDGAVARLAPHVAPLADLKPGGRVFLVPGNHEYYSGAAPWLRHFESLGLRVLLNEYVVIAQGRARIVVGGVVDPAARLDDPRQRPRPDLAVAPEAGRAFRLLLAHNPKIAPVAEQAGFDLQLSGHTHAGQFFPWTLAVHLVHAPHVAGLSRRGRLWVYVSAGTGTWGPPVRFGTEPELTLLRLVRGDRRQHGG